MKRKSFCFWKTLCKYCWWKLTFVVCQVFSCHLKWWRKQFMNNSGDVDDAEADYNCPSWKRAFDVHCIFVGGVARLGQEQEREGVVPNTSQGHCSNTATYLLPTTPTLHLREIVWIMCGTNCSLCYLYHYTPLYFQSATRSCEQTVLPHAESLCPGRLASQLSLSAYRLGDLL